MPNIFNYENKNQANVFVEIFQILSVGNLKARIGLDTTSCLMHNKQFDDPLVRQVYLSMLKNPLVQELLEDVLF